MTVTVKDSLHAPLLKRKTFTPLPVRCGFQLPSQYHEHSLVLLFPLRICASGWRGWTLLRASRSAFWRSLGPSVWWELHTRHCPGHLCRAGVWQGCVCPQTRALQRVRWPGLGWRVQVWGGGAWAPGLPQGALSRGHMSPQWSCSCCLFRWDAGQAFCLCEHPVYVILLKSCLLLPAYSEVRLMTNGSSQCEGQVEMNISGRWRALCASHWSLANANVVCFHLSCGVAISTPRGPHLVEGGDQILTARFHCSGTESFLWSCSVTALGGPDCSHGNTASVICSGKREGRSTGTQDAPRVKCLQGQRVRLNGLQSQIFCGEICIVVIVHSFFRSRQEVWRGIIYF